MTTEYKLSYTATEIDEKLGKIDSLVTKNEVPTKTSELVNDSGFIIEYSEIDPTVPAWAKKSTKPSYTAIEVGADASGTANSLITSHDEDITAHKDIREQINSIRLEIASKEQLSPEFANTIEECTDTTKLYVLPNGYIYAYMYTENAGASYTNVLSTAINSDGSAYVGTNGEKGYKAGYRLNSSGVEAAMDGMFVTGFIPVKQNDVVRLSGIEWGSTSAKAGSCYLHLYKSDFTKAYDGYARADQNFGLSGDEEFDASGNLVRFTLSNASNGVDLSTVAYMRLSSPSITAESIITINEEITDNATGGGYAWTNTGHAFVPADYEDRIVNAEKAIKTLDNAKTEHETRISALENAPADGLSDYVVAEAEDVIDRVIAAQGNRTFTFAAITDMHYGNGSYTDGVENACKAMKHIDKRIKLDAVAVLGDYTDGYPASGLNNAIGDFKTINSVLDDLRFAPNLRTQGNHDYYANNSPITHRFIQAYSEDVVWGDKLGGYFYKDFEDFRLRVICVNTTETDNTNIACSAEQYQWFADSLDLSGKANVAEWQILILSHHPLDWYTTDGRLIFGRIISAYENGSSWATVAGDVSCNYAGKNNTKLIGNIHGHIHNLLTAPIFMDTGLGTQTGIYRISTPEACVGRENQYDSPWKESTSYPKTQGTAEDTAFCIYCIDLDAHTVNAICYGAGYDREINY